MRLTIILLTATFLNAAANGHAQTVTIKGKDIPLIKVFAEIRRQTGMTFFFQDQWLSNTTPVSLSVKNEPVEEVLQKCFASQPLNYQVVDKVIVLQPKTNTVANAIVEKSPPIVVSGKITNQEGQPLAGVSIVARGTDKGTMSKADGSFQVTVDDNKTVLMFSFVGYQSQEFVVGSRTSFSIVMTPLERDLDKVIVIGYGSARQKDFAGAVGVVPVEDMKKAPVVSFDQALAGRVAGVEVRSVDGQPGSPINIVIRGGNSVTQSNSPLYVVDDFPLENNDNNSINPADIESIVILKDAAATAIYGSRGANGVILITTKRGKAGEPVVKYDASYGYQTKTKTIPVMSPYEFVRLQLEIDNANATATYLANGKSLEDYKSVKAIDWYDKIFQRATMMTHTLSVSGGTTKSEYSMSGSFTDQDGVVLNSGFKRYQGRATLDQTVNNKLKVGVSVNYADYDSYGTIINNTEAGSPNGSYMYSVWSYRPVEIDGQNVDLENELFDPSTNTTSGIIDRRVNPVLQARNEVRKAKNTNFFGNGYLEYSILDNLKLRVTAGINKTVSQNIAFNNSKTRTGSPFSPITLGVNGSKIYGENINYSNENTLTYTKSIHNQHYINVVAGFSQQRNEVTTSGIEVIQLPNESLGISGLDEGTPRTVYATSSASRLMSVFGRLMYNYKSKYYIQGVLRGDGSSKFVKGNQWGFFPSVGVKYDMSQEKFMSRLKFLSDAKIRGSFGYTGNNRVGDFPYLTSITFPTGFAYSFGNATPTYGAAPSGIGNPKLKWESTRAIDFGVDLAFLQDRISFTADYYHKTTYDLLLNAPVAATSGYSRAFENIGSVANYGFEFTLNTVNFSNKSFKWTTGFNISFNRNKVLALTDGQETLTSTSGGVYGGVPKNIAKVGEPIAMFLGVIFDGLYTYDDFNQLTNGTYVLKDNVAGNGSNRATIQPGYVKYRDLNNDGTVNSDDYTIIGNPNADFVGGLNNNIQYKNFDLNVFLRFSYGNDVLNANRITFEGYDNFLSNTNMYATYANRWSPTNTNTDIPVRAGRGPSYWSTRQIEDASMLRLGVVAVGYTFSGKMMRKLKMQSIRVNFAGNNLYTWTRYSGLDPEVSVRNSNLTPSLDFSAYPRARTITFGLNATF